MGRRLQKRKGMFFAVTSEDTIKPIESILPADALCEISHNMETTVCVSVSAMLVNSDIFGTLINICSQACVPLTFRLRSGYVPSTFHSLLSVCLSLSACDCLTVSICLSVCWSVASQYIRSSRAFECKRSTLCVPMCTLHHGCATICIPMYAFHYMPCSVCAPLHVFHCAHSTV